MLRCKECGLATDAEELSAGDGRCRYCVSEKPESGKAGSTVRPVEVQKPVDQRAARIILTTGQTVPGREMLEIVQIVAAEVALGMNIFKDIANNWRDTFGGRSASVQKTLKDARSACLDELRNETAACGADAVIAVRLDYSEISTSGGTGGGIMFVAATGTAVKLG